MNWRTVLRLGWPIASAVLGLLIVVNTLFVAGNLADALAGQPELGDESTAQLIILIAIGCVLMLGGVAVALLDHRHRRARDGS